MSKTFSRRLKELRNSRKLSQEELAGKLNIPRATIAGYESGTRSLPREKRLRDIAAFFGVSIDYLLGRTDIENEAKNLEAQIVELIRNAQVHYDHQYTYTDEEKEKIIEILLSLANMDPTERKIALNMLAKISKTSN